MRLLFGMIAVVAFPAAAWAQAAGAIVASPLPPPTVLTPTPDQAPQLMLNPGRPADCLDTANVSIKEFAAA